ncbi:hypothetical protein [Halalkalibacterium halodurans]|uniref:hypothetical protein n=1 Tax=Halalkalibacterium halodurans TaxID=86665 RepID=UPI0010FE8E03|nr:hypothetical protein [Halalkalibacterium halodurans]
MKKLWLGLSTCVLSVMLVACGTGGTSGTEGEDPEEIIEDVENAEDEAVEEEDAVEEEPVDEEETAEEEPTEEETTEDEASEETSDASEVKEIEVEVEGDKEMRSAQFNRGELGYSIYVLENFSLTGEEPRRDVILSDYDGSFFTRIIQEGSSADTNALKNNIIEHTTGTIEDNYPTPLEDVDFSLREKVTSDDGETNIFHVAKTYPNGETYRFELYIPNKEAQEGILPSFWAMLKTFQP